MIEPRNKKNPITTIRKVQLGSEGLIKLEEGTFRLYVGEMLCATSSSSKHLGRYAIDVCSEGVRHDYDLALGDEY